MYLSATLFVSRASIADARKGVARHTKYYTQVACCNMLYASDIAVLRINPTQDDSEHRELMIAPYMLYQHSMPKYQHDYEHQINGAGRRIRLYT
jgi:hypothetical protein